MLIIENRVSQEGKEMHESRFIFIWIRIVQFTPDVELRGIKQSETLEMEAIHFLFLFPKKGRIVPGIPSEDRGNLG